MLKIHPTAIISPETTLGNDVEIGPYTITEGRVSIGDGCMIGPHVVIKGPTSIGKNCRIYQFASIGEIPQDLKFQGEETELVIGDGNVIREYVTINRGTQGGGGRTVIGEGNFLMSYVHIAHDCVLGDYNILANVATLAGHITIEDFAIIGALSAVHQFARIGSYSFVSGMTGVAQDIPPYVKAAGNRSKLYGLNTIGLKRHDFSDESISALKRVYRIVFRSKLRLSEAIEQIESESIGALPEVQKFLTFLKTSKRGICR